MNLRQSLMILIRKQKHNKLINFWLAQQKNQQVQIQVSFRL